MKLTRYFFVVAVSTALATGLTGCLSQDEFLEEHSYKFDDQTFYQSESDMELALNGCYRQIQSLMMGQTHGAHSWMIGGIGLDTYSQKGGNDHFSNWNTLTSESGYTRHWYDNLFKLINRANTVIDMIDERVNIQYSSEEKKLAIRAEAVFFRGWAYRVLAGMYGNVPILEHHATEITTGYTPSNRQTVWKFCKKDFEYAAVNLPKTASKPGKLTRAAADHYLAEISLALGDFDNAVAASTRVIDGTDGDYHLMTTRFGSRAGEATDRYGNSLAAPAGAYWDLFREGGNQNSTDNKEAIWVCQYNYGTYSTGGGGNEWWRINANNIESVWMSTTVRNDTKKRTLSNGTQIYLWGDNVACFQPGIMGSAKSNVPSAKDRYEANIARDSMGGNVAYQGTGIIPTYYVRDRLWEESCKNGKVDFRGSEVMIQRNWYTPGGTRWLDEKAAAYARAEKARGTADEAAYAITASDTVEIFPRFWKFSDDRHPNGDNKAYDCDWYMLRIAETYLIRAEAYLALGEKSKAAADINVLRDRANASYCTAADIDIDYILDERARELLGEENRWITLNRLSVNPNATYISDCHPIQDETTGNTMYDRARKYAFGYENLSGSNQPREWDPVEKRYISNFHPYNYQYPIPTQVIQSNTGIEYPQNTGY